MDSNDKDTTASVKGSVPMSYSKESETGVFSWYGNLPAAGQVYLKDGSAQFHVLLR